jgi:general secretion pathway protein G
MEILVVLVIIGLLVGIVGIPVTGVIKQAKVDSTQAQLRTIKLALERYYADNGFFPSESQGLEALVVQPNTPPVPEKYNPEGYLEKLPLDGWKRPFFYSSPARSGKPYEVISYGEDGEVGGEDFSADLSTSDIGS